MKTSSLKNNIVYPYLKIFVHHFVDNSKNLQTSFVGGIPNKAAIEPEEYCEQAGCKYFISDKRTVESLIRFLRKKHTSLIQIS
jgi:hypothetical protein